MVQSASAYGLGAVLLQVFYGVLCRIAYVGHAMMPAESNDSVTGEGCPPTVCPEGVSHVLR